MKLEDKMFVTYFISSVVYLNVKASIMFCFGNYGSASKCVKCVAGNLVPADQLILSLGCHDTQIMLENIRRPSKQLRLI